MQASALAVFFASRKEKFQQNKIYFKRKQHICHFIFLLLRTNESVKTWIFRNHVNITYLLQSSFLKAFNVSLLGRHFDFTADTTTTTALLIGLKSPLIFGENRNFDKSLTNKYENRRDVWTKIRNIRYDI